MKGRGRKPRAPVADAVAATIAVVTAVASVSAARATQANVTAGRPLPGTLQAVAFGDVPMVAWVEAGPDGGQRVRAAAPPEAPGRWLGPAGPGSDGSPTAAATADGSLWVVASRTGAAAGRLWAQRWQSGLWRLPIAGPRARRWNHHPAAAAGSGGPWIVWVSEDDSLSASDLYASRWNGSGWTPPDRLPRAPSRPMAPAIAVDGNDRPVVVWAASNGSDAEVWLTVREANGWTAPLALSRDAVPDISPTIAAGDDKLLVAWSSFTVSGYLIKARTRDLRDGWGPEALLGREPGVNPAAAIAADGPAVFWSAPTGASGKILRAARRQPQGWTPASDVAPVGGEAVAATVSADGRLLLSWAGPNGRLQVVEGPSLGDAVRLLESAIGAQPPTGESGEGTAGVPRPAAATRADGIPRTYSAFGDSITEGLVVFENGERVINETPGYPGPLEEMLSGLLGPVEIINQGASGETTAAGLSRIESALGEASAEAVLLMEGTNDVSQLIDTDTIVFNLREMIMRSQDRGILTFLGLLLPRFEPGSGFGGSPNARTNAVNDQLATLAQETGVELADTHTPFVGRSELYSNNVHPNEAGYTVLAEAWFDSLSPALLSMTNRGDVNASGRVDGIDLVQLALAFGSREGEARYDPAADINGDGIVDGFDLGILADFFGQTLETP